MSSVTDREINLCYSQRGRERGGERKWWNGAPSHICLFGLQQMVVQHQREVPLATG